MITVGIDEVGRGCWAGPVVAGAVALFSPVSGLKDSKLLSKLKLQRLNDDIMISGAVIGIGWVDAATIDKIGINPSVELAMRRALEQLTINYDEVVIDGHINFLREIPNTRALVKADSLVPAVSAASIVAKVARDAYMAEIDELYPGYGFKQHVGYGTAQHSAALKTLGVNDQHRKSYKPIKALLQ